MKFVRPLYRELRDASPELKAVAISAFKRFKPSYHSIAQKMVSRDLGLGESASAAVVKVGVIMGSDSDLPCMKAACDILKEFDVPYEVTVVSAHRTPTRMYEYAKAAHGRGLQVIIAGAGGAAHLP